MSADPALPDGSTVPDRLGARYAATLGAQVVRLLASLAVAVIVPRTLGPALYGTYTFLLSTAATLRAFVDTVVAWAPQGLGSRRAPGSGPRRPISPPRSPP